MRADQGVTSQGFTCRLLRDAAAIDAVAPEWDRLWRARSPRHVFQGYAWHRAVLDAHPERAPCVAVVEEGERAAGLLPLWVEGRRARFLGAPYGDYNDLLADAARAGDVLQAMLGALDAARLGELVLESVRGDAQLRQAAGALPPAARRRLHCAFAAPCPTALLAAVPGVVEGVAGKKSLRRHERALAALGPVRFRHLESREEAAALLPAFFAQHQERRALAGGRSLFAAPGARRFYAALVERLGLETVRFSVLEVDGAPVAFHFGFECDGRLVWYKPAFAVEHADLGVGEVLLGRLFAYAGARGLEELDFTRGGEAFKDRFANAARAVYRLTIAPPGLAGHARVLRRHLADVLRSSPLAAPLRALRSARRRARRTGAGAALAGAWRRYVHARDEVALFHRARAAGPAPPSACTLRTATLGDLARLASDHPERFDAGRLRAARRRLRAGDRPFLAQGEGGLVLLAWMGRRPEVAAFGEGEDAAPLLLEGEGALIDDVWAAPAGRAPEAAAEALRALAAAAPAEDVWLCADARDTALARALGQAGFAERRRFVRERWFRGAARVRG